MLCTRNYRHEREKMSNKSAKNMPKDNFIWCDLYKWHFFRFFRFFSSGKVKNGSVIKRPNQRVIFHVHKLSALCVVCKFKHYVSCLRFTPRNAKVWHDCLPVIGWQFNGKRAVEKSERRNRSHFFELIIIICIRCNRNLYRKWTQFIIYTLCVRGVFVCWIIFSISLLRWKYWNVLVLRQIQTWNLLFIGEKESERAWKLQKEKDGKTAKRKRTSEFIRTSNRKRNEGGWGGMKWFENLKLSKLVFIT